MNKFILSLSMLLAAPALADEAACSHPDDAPAAKPDASALILRGDKVPATGAAKVADLLAKPSDFEGKTLVVEGEVRKACTRKGCWMELAPKADAKGAGVRVTFKDYGFFVPTDSAGSHARVSGVVKVAELSPQMAEHYASEGATVPKGADGKPREVQLVATGVELRR